MDKVYSSSVRMEHRLIESSKVIPIRSISGEILTPTINDSGTTFFIDLNISNKNEIFVLNPPNYPFLNSFLFQEIVK